MHRRKIVLLGIDEQSFYDQTLWIDQHLQYQPYLLVKLTLPILSEKEEALPKVSFQELALKEALLSAVGGKNGHGANGTNKLELPKKVTQMRSYEASFGDVLQEGQFADLLVVEDSLVSAEYTQHGSPATLNELTAQVRCPTLVLKKPLIPVEQLVLFYDGSAQDFAMIQQFGQDFNRFSTSLPVTLLLLHTQPVPPLEEKLLIEYLKLHFYDLAVHKISEEYQHLLPVAIERDKGTLVVSSRSRPLPQFVTNYLPSESIFNLQFPA
ncbi:MAG: hypothetical protein AAF992_21250 [Bacteroidota bacterium]